MRKRTIISIILVLVILGLSHNVWLTIRPKPQSTVTSIRGRGGSSSTEINRLLTLRTRVSIKFDAMIFIIIAILGFMLSYKLTSYLADFKVEKKYSRLDILFLAACAVLMFLPMSHISDAKKSEAENRNLALWKPLILKNGQINYNFGRDFDSWFSDRFNMREALVQYYYKGLANISFDFVRTKNGYYYKKNGWMFYSSALNEFGPINYKFFDKYIKNLVRFNQWLAERNIKLYVVIIPSKEVIRKEENKCININRRERAAYFMNYLKEKNLDLNVTYYYDDFRRLRDKDSVFYKTDHHITDFTVYELYKDIINNMARDFKELSVAPEDKFNIYERTLCRYSEHRTFDGGCNYKNGNVHDEKLLMPKYTYYDYIHPEEIAIEQKNIFHYIHTNKNKKYKLFLLGDSFEESLTYFLNTSFYQIDKHRRRFNIKNKKGELAEYEKAITDFKPDMVLLLFYSPSLSWLEKLYN